MDVRIASPSAVAEGSDRENGGRRSRKTNGRENPPITESRSSRRSSEPTFVHHRRLGVPMGGRLVWAERIEMLLPYQVNANSVMALTGNSDAKFHALRWPSFTAGTLLSARSPNEKLLEWMRFESYRRVFESPAGRSSSTSREPDCTRSRRHVALLGNEHAAFPSGRTRWQRSPSAPPAALTSENQQCTSRRRMPRARAPFGATRARGS